MSDKITVPIPFREGEREATRLQVFTRLIEVKARKRRVDKQFAEFAKKFEVKNEDA